MLAEAMPRVRQELATAENTILESNTILGFLQPDLYITMLASATTDFKRSAQRYLERANAVVLHGSDVVTWSEVSLKPVSGKPIFHISPPEYVTPELVGFVRSSLNHK